MAERKGFEPLVPFDTHAFQACAFDHSATSPDKKISTSRKMSIKLEMTSIERSTQ